MIGLHRAVIGLHRAVFGLHRAVFGLHRAVFDLRRAVVCSPLYLVRGCTSSGPSILIYGL